MLSGLLYLIGFFVLLVFVINQQDQINTLKTEIKKLTKLINYGVFKNIAHEEKPLENTPSVIKPALEEKKKPEFVVEEKIHKDEPQSEHLEEIREIINSQKTTQVEKSGFEKVFLGNIFNKIGALALITGIGIFVKVISEFIEFTPIMRLSAAFIAGLTMIGLSLKLHKDNMKNYAEVLMGTGIAVLFITIYCASSLYHLMPVAAAIIYATALVVLTYFIADKYKSFSTFAIGFIGGYLNPFFINSDISVNFLFGYLLFLNLISIIYVQKNPNKIALNYINLILTTLTVSIFNVFGNGNLNYLYPIALWALFILNDVFTTIKNKDGETQNPCVALNYFNFIILLFFAKVVDSVNHSMETGLFILGAGLLYVVLAAFVKDKNKETVKPFAYGAMLCVLASTYYMLSGTPRIIMWALEGVIISYTASRYKYLANWALGFLLMAFTGIFFVKNAIYMEDLNSYFPIWNFRLALFGVPVLCAFASSVFLKENAKLTQILKFLYISLIYIFITVETNLYCAKYLSTSHSDADLLRNLSFAIIGFIYAINMKRLSLSFKSPFISYAGSLIFVLASLTLFISSCSMDFIGMYPILNMRFTAYLFAIGAALYYFKKTNSNVFYYLALIFGFACAHFEIAYLTEQNPLAISVTWILYSGAISLAGIFKNDKQLQKTGIWISILAVLKILLFDIAQMEAVYKVIAFMTLGVILMIVSFIYTKIKGEE